jgi:hypothetical protein
MNCCPIPCDPGELSCVLTVYFAIAVEAARHAWWLIPTLALLAWGIVKAVKAKK